MALTQAREGRVVMNVAVDPEVRRAVRVAAVHAGRTLQSLVDEGLRWVAETHGPPDDAAGKGRGGDVLPPKVEA